MQGFGERCPAESSKEKKRLPGGREGRREERMQQPKQAGHLCSSPLRAQTPSSGLAKLARD